MVQMNKNWRSFGALAFLFNSLAFAVELPRPPVDAGALMRQAEQSRLLLNQKELQSRATLAPELRLEDGVTINVKSFKFLGVSLIDV